MILIFRMIGLIGLFAIFGCNGLPTNNNIIGMEEKVSFEKQLKTFKSLGFEFNKSASEVDIINMWGREELESNPFELLYISLGAQVEREPWTPITDQCWHFDVEAIGGTGAYVSIIENLKRVSNGELNFKDITDVVDWENKIASVSFEINGDKYSWDLEFNDDWVDGNLFSKIVKLTEKYNTNGHYTYYDTGGQDMVIGWATDKKIKQIKSQTGLKLVWLN